MPNFALTGAEATLVSFAATTGVTDWERRAAMSTAFRGIETKLIHCGERAVEGAVCLPVFQSVTTTPQRAA